MARGTEGSVALRQKTELGDGLSPWSGLISDANSLPLCFAINQNEIDSELKRLIKLYSCIFLFTYSLNSNGIVLAVYTIKPRVSYNTICYWNNVLTYSGRQFPLKLFKNQESLS